MNILKSINKAIEKDCFHRFVNPPQPLDICIKCRESKPPSKMSSRFMSHKICGDCYLNLDRCSNCRRRSLRLNDCDICFNCTSATSGVHGYSYKPRGLFHRVYNGIPRVTENAKKYRHYGVEIETDRESSYTLTTSSKIASIASLIGKGLTNSESLLYVKEDSTCSFEFVSHPFTWKYFNQYGKHIFYTLFNVLKNDDFVSHNAEDSGLHIHVSKASIKHTTLMKVLSLVFNPSNYDFILDVSQREEDSLKNWANPILYESFIEGVKNPYSYMTYNRDNRNTLEGQLNRSSAINLMPSNTIEFRLFRGTLNMNSFLKNLQFVKSSLDWADNVSLIEANENGLKSYLNFLEKNQKDYYDLCWFLKKRRWGQFQKTNNYFVHHHSTNLINLRYDSDTMQLFKGVS